MELRQLAAALSLFVLVAGCTGGRSVPPKETGQQPPVRTETPAPVEPSTLGVTLEALGPGLVVEGYTQQLIIQVELRKGSTVLQSEQVTPKEDGRWRLTWPAAGAEGGEIVVSEPGAGGRVLVRGPVGSKLLEGLFYSASFTGVHVDAATPLTEVTVSGLTRVPGGKFRVELRAGDRVLAAHDLTAAADGRFEAKLPVPAGAHQVWFLNRTAPELMVPIVTR
jgi:hypothetical protein